LGKVKAADEAFRSVLRRNSISYALNLPQK
jgi:hypothetical protein